MPTLKKTITTLKIPKYCGLKELAKICNVPVKQVMKSLVTRKHKKYFIANEEYVFSTKNAIILPFELSAQFVETNINYKGNNKNNVAIEEDTVDPINIMNELLLLEMEENNKNKLKKNVKQLNDKPITFEPNAILPPTVVVLGERDHGKTTLVNALTGRRVREKGGITQRVGAARYYFNYFENNNDDTHNNQILNREASITLLDTPGHQHFVDMQRESAFNADMALVVIACDEGITPGTANVMQHAFDADIPLSFVFTKMDLLTTDDEKKRFNEIENYLKTTFPNSPMTTLNNLNDRANPNRALECGNMLSTWAEENQMYVRSNGYASCFVLDSFADRSRGMLLRVLILEGKLNIDDSFVAGTMHGIIRNMYCVFNQTNPIVGSGINNYQKSKNNHKNNMNDNDTSHQMKYNTTYEVIEAKPGDVVDVMLRGHQGKLRNLSPPRMGEGFFALPLENSKKIVEYRIMESTLELHKNNHNNNTVNTNGDDGIVIQDKDPQGNELSGLMNQQMNKQNVVVVDNNDDDNDRMMGKHYPLVVKADTSSGLLSLNSIIDTTSIDVVVGGIGRITKYDIDVASLYETIIVSYNIPISKEIHDYAMSKDVYIEQGDVLPELLERIFQHFDVDISDDTKKVMGEEEEDV